MDDEDADMQGSPKRGSQEEVTQTSLSNEAAEWFVRLRDDRLAMRHRERNVRWLKRSPAHIAELLRIQQVYQVLRAANVQNRTPVTPGQEISNVIELGDQRPPSSPKSLLLEWMDAPPRRERPAGFAPWKVAAAVACLTVALLFGFMAKVAWLDRTLETELGEWRTVLLTDGTKIRMGPGSLLRVSFGDDHRTVRLIRGQVMFDVAKDQTRPFYVTSEMIGVLAIGTEFRVARLGGKDIVAVTEGSVALYRDGRDAVHGAVSAAPAQLAEATGGVALSAGDQVAVTRSTRSTPVAKQKVNRNYEQAWAEGWLVFEDKTVAEVASDFNRFNKLQIVIATPSIASRRVTLYRGRATDPASFVAALATTADITVVRDDPNVLRLEPREPAAEISESPQTGESTADVPPTLNPNPI
jgi:transmembrane sensor